MTRRKDPRGEATRIAVIEAAERLFAQRGIDDVSLREIGAAAGSENTSVAIYYFKSKQGLVEAIYRHRLPEIDRHRAELLDKAEQEGAGEDVATLLLVHWTPIYQLTDGDGHHSYSGFLDNMVRSNWTWLRQPLSDVFPASEILRSRLCRLSGLGDSALFEYRFAIVAGIMIAAIREIDRRAMIGDERLSSGRLFHDAIQMAAEALRAAEGVQDGRVSRRQ